MFRFVGIFIRILLIIYVNFFKELFVYFLLLLFVVCFIEVEGWDEIDLCNEEIKQGFRSVKFYLGELNYYWVFRFFVEGLVVYFQV